MFNFGNPNTLGRQAATPSDEMVPGGEPILEDAGMSPPEPTSLFLCSL
jgi:hypothetical protein